MQAIVSWLMCDVCAYSARHPGQARPQVQLVQAMHAPTLLGIQAMHAPTLLVIQTYPLRMCFMRTCNDSETRCVVCVCVSNARDAV